MIIIYVTRESNWTFSHISVRSSTFLWFGLWIVL